MFFNKDKSKIIGELSFKAYHDGKQFILANNYRDFPKEAQIFCGCFEIEIDLNDFDFYSNLYKVYETSNKIIEYAHNNNIKPIDLHLAQNYTNINNDKYKYYCCIGINYPNEIIGINLITFLLHFVFPYFAWQAYYQTFNKKPFWGEYSHGRLGLREKREDYIIQRN